MDREKRHLNLPAKSFFEKKMKCDFASCEFHFSAGKLDILAYNREQKCFHVAEGKYAQRVASVGHAIGQLIAYISMLQESGFDFLDRISKGENLFLSDFSEFLENKSIKVCFYIVLPAKLREKILSPTMLMLNNVGDFGNSIGVLFADKNKCFMEKKASPINIKIRKTYDKSEFLSTIRDKFLSGPHGRKLILRPSSWTIVAQFMEKEGNSALHFEVWLRRIKKSDKNVVIEVGFHLEWGHKGWSRGEKSKKRAEKIRRAMRRARMTLRKQGYSFQYQKKWGQSWSRLYAQATSQGKVLEAQDMENVLKHLRALADALLPQLERINWGRTKFRLNS